MIKDILVTLPVDDAPSSVLDYAVTLARDLLKASPPPKKSTPPSRGAGWEDGVALLDSVSGCLCLAVCPEGNPSTT